MKTIENFKLVSLSVLLVAGLSGCDNSGLGGSGTAGKDNAARNTTADRDATLTRDSTAGQDTTANRDTAGMKLDRTMDQAGLAVDDAAITAKVKAAIIAEPGLKAMQINVDTDKGVVTLSGSVDSVSKSEKAKTLADAVSGVKAVENRLELKS